jgi:hypothetical protein
MSAFFFFGITFGFRLLLKILRPGWLPPDIPFAH